MNLVAPTYSISIKKRLPVSVTVPVMVFYKSVFPINVSSGSCRRCTRRSKSYN